MVDKNKFVLPEVEQIALIVKDLETTAAYLSSSLGIGPFRISERYGPTKVCGEPTLAKRKLGIVKMGRMSRWVAIQADIWVGDYAANFVTGDSKLTSGILFGGRSK